MSNAAVFIRPVDAAALLELSAVVPLPTSPLIPWLEDVDPSATSEQDMLDRGLIVEDNARKRTNVAVAATLGTLARPEETLHLHFADGGREREMVLAKLGNNLVGMRARDTGLELAFPIVRSDLVAALHNGIAGDTDPAVALDASVSPVGQFLIGVLARHHGAAFATPARISASVDVDALDLQRAVGLAILDPTGLDAVFRNVDRVSTELSALATASVVARADDGTFGLDPKIAVLLASEPTGSLTATRMFHGAAAHRGTTTITAVRFASAILVIRNQRTDQGPRVRIHTMSPRQLAAAVSALLFTDAELGSLNRA